MASPRVGLFLDRDGVLNVNTHYPHLIEDLYLAPGVVETFKLLCHYPDIVPVVVSNQSGVGRGYFSQSDVVYFEAALAKRIFDQTGYLIPKQNWFHCWSDNSSHPWRKPNPGMIQAAAQQLNLDLTRSMMIGDKLSDIEAAIGAGIRYKLLLPPGQGHRLDTPVQGWLRQNETDHS